MPAPAATSAFPRGAQSSDRWFFSGLTALMAAAVFVGFSPSFYMRNWVPLSRPVLPLTPLVILHGTVFSSWILLLMVQTGLVAAGRIDLHRRLGMLGAGLAAGMVVLGVTTALYGARRGSGPPGSEPLPFLAIPLFDIFGFAVLVAAGIRMRRVPATHKRLMLLSTIAILDAGIARWPLAIMRFGPPVFFGIDDLFLLALVGYDWITLGRVHRATLWGGGLILISQPLRLFVSGTGAWHAFAHWAVGLVS